MFSEFNTPKKFVGLHAHSTFSTYDGLGYPSEHIDYVLSNGMNAWALTDHGNANGLAHARSHTAKLQKKGIDYRQLYGVECYFVPSLKDWATDYAAHKQAIVDAKNAAEAEKLSKKKVDIDADEDADAGGLVVEDENESKSLNVMNGNVVIILLLLQKIVMASRIYSRWLKSLSKMDFIVILVLTLICLKNMVLI